MRLNQPTRSNLPIHSKVGRAIGVLILINLNLFNYLRNKFGVIKRIKRIIDLFNLLRDKLEVVNEPTTV